MNLDRPTAEIGAPATPLDFVLSAVVLMVHSLIIQILNKDVEGTGLSISPWVQDQGWPAAGIVTADCNTLSLAVQPDFSPPHCPLTESVLHRLVYKDVTGGSRKGLLKFISTTATAICSST